MILYPAIDLKNGRVVRLEQGRADRETVYFQDPLEPARAWQAAGATWIHVVDLDGAFSGEFRNLDSVARIAALGMKVQMGGGLRSAEAVRKVLDFGVSRVVIGTKAATEPEFVGALVREFGGERIAVGIDARDGKVAIKGWVDVLQLDALELARKVESLGVRTVIYTDISRDGMLTGPNFEAQEALCRATGMRVIASGGVARPQDLARFRTLAQTLPNLDGVITGKAVYEGTIDLVAELKVSRPE